MATGRGGAGEGKHGEHTTETDVERDNDTPEVDHETGEAGRPPRRGRVSPEVTQRLRESTSTMIADGTHVDLISDGNAAADRMDDASHAETDTLDSMTVKESSRRAEDGMREAASSGTSKRWYARWKFWGFIFASVGGVTTLVLQGLALRPTKPDSPHADDAARAKEILAKWKALPDPQFWNHMKAYVGEQDFSLETQAYLMHYVAVFFEGPNENLPDADVTRLSELLQNAYLDAAAQRIPVPSTAIYARLAAGLDRTSSPNQPTAPLSRRTSAQIAMCALYALMDVEG